MEKINKDKDFFENVMEWTRNKYTKSSQRYLS